VTQIQSHWEGGDHVYFNSEYLHTVRDIGHGMTLHDVGVIYCESAL